MRGIEEQTQKKKKVLESIKKLQDHIKERQRDRTPCHAITIEFCYTCLFVN